MDKTEKVFWGVTIAAVAAATVAYVSGRMAEYRRKLAERQEADSLTGLYLARNAEPASFPGDPRLYPRHVM